MFIYLCSKSFITSYRYKHVRKWLKRASIVIRFEDLIVDPIACVERLLPYLNLPQPDLEKLPTFDDLKYGSAIYVGHKRRERFFWRGSVGSWRDEMPEDIQKLFWKRHGDVLKELGYATENEVKKLGGRPSPLQKII